MGELLNFPRALAEVEELKKAVVEGGGGPPHNGDMESRVTALEAIVKTLATKEDLARLEGIVHKEIGAQTWKLVTFVCGFGTALVAATYFIAKHAA